MVGVGSCEQLFWLVAPYRVAAHVGPQLDRLHFALPYFEEYCIDQRARASLVPFDLPIALPTAVAGITLTELYATNGWLGAPLARLGVTVDFTWLGILVALTFVGLPFVVRTVEPVLADLDHDIEEAARTLGATPLQIFRRVLLPPLVPALMTGFTLAFGRAIGEYGSVIFIAGNAPGSTEIVPLLIVIKLEEYDYIGAAVLGALMLAFSFVLMFAINGLTHWSNKRLGH